MVSDNQKAYLKNIVEVFVIIISSSIAFLTLGLSWFDSLFHFGVWLVVFVTYLMFLIMIKYIFNWISVRQISQSVWIGIIVYAISPILGYNWISDFTYAFMSALGNLIIALFVFLFGLIIFR